MPSTGTIRCSSSDRPPACSSIAGTSGSSTALASTRRPPPRQPTRRERHRRPAHRPVHLLPDHLVHLPPWRAPGARHRASRPVVSLTAAAPGAPGTLRRDLLILAILAGLLSLRSEERGA